MDFLSLLAACAMSSHPGVPPTIYQIAHLHDGNPLAIEIIDRGLVYTPDTREQAIGITTALVEAGAHVRVGLSQLNAQLAMNVYGVTIDSLFDSCTNISLGADLLEESLHRHANISFALADYLDSSTSSSIARGWAQDVLAQPTMDSNPEPFSRRYSTPQQRIFVSSPDTSHRQPEPSVEHRLLISPEANETEQPLLPESISLPSREVRREQSSRSGESGPSNKNRPYPPVTDERLPTTSELNNDD